MAGSDDLTPDEALRAFWDNACAEGMYIAASGIRHIGHNFAGLDGALVAAAIANIIENFAQEKSPRSPEEIPQKVIEFPNM